jgi:hypothetical protein
MSSSIIANFSSSLRMLEVAWDLFLAATTLAFQITRHSKLSAQAVP